MKKRMDFVTNSSSSSFVIGVHKDFDKNDFNKLINREEEAINNISRWFSEYTKEHIIEEIYNSLKKIGDIKIDDWQVSGGECNNETYDIFNLFLYELRFNTDTEHLKIKTLYN